MDLIPIKITIRRGNPDLGEKPMKYPNGHEPFLIDKLGIGMHYGKTNQLGNGDPEEYAITALPEDLALAYIAAAGGDVQQLTELEAEDFFTQHIPEPVVVITDRHAVDAVLAMSAAGIAIPLELKDALDPKTSTPGISTNKRRGLSGKLNGRKIKK